MTQEHSITWGALQFAGSTTPDADYLIEAMADGSNFGNPQEVVEIVRSLLIDGSLAVLEGWDNREVAIRLRLSAPDGVAGTALADAEAALMAELMATSKSPLVWVPPALDAPTCVFDVVAARLERDTSDGWDVDEAMQECRYYLLTLTCLPFARPGSTVVVPALPINGSTTANIDTCDATTGWSLPVANGLFATSVSTSSGYVQAGGTIPVGGEDSPYVEFLRTGAITMGTTPYLRVTISNLRLSTLGPRLRVGNGASSEILEPIAVGAGAVVAGISDYYFQPTITSPTSIRVIVGGSISTKEFPAWVRVHHVARTDILPSTGTRRQLARSAAVSGSAPTQAAIRLFDATPAALGTDVLVHTSRNTIWQPALRPYLTSTAGTTDATMVSGARNTLATPMIFRVPASLLTEGTYSLMARMSVTTTGSLGWSARMVNAAGAATVGSSVVISGSTAVGVTTGYQVLSLARIPLPVLAAEADQMVELTLTGTANMTIDEAWLFGLHDGVLTWIQDSDSLTWIEIRSPELGAARPSVFGGTGAKGANSVSIGWKCRSFGTHRFMPGLMQVFTVTSSSLVSQSELEFYPRYHSHVQDVAA